MGALSKKIVGAALVLSLGVGGGLFAYNSVGDTSAQSSPTKSVTQSQETVAQLSDQEILLKKAQELKKAVLKVKELSSGEGAISPGKKKLLSLLNERIKTLKKENVSEEKLSLIKIQLEKINKLYHLL